MADFGATEMMHLLDCLGNCDYALDHAITTTI